MGPYYFDYKKLLKNRTTTALRLWTVSRARYIWLHEQTSNRSTHELPKTGVVVLINSIFDNKTPFSTHKTPKKAQTCQNKSVESIKTW